MGLIVLLFGRICPQFAQWVTIKHKNPQFAQWVTIKHKNPPESMLSP